MPSPVITSPSLSPRSRLNHQPIRNPTQSAISASGGSTRLDIFSLGPTVRELLSAGIAPATRKNYGTGERRYLQFCNKFNISTPFPVSEQVLLAFLAHLHREGLAAGTLKNYLAAVSFAQISLGMGDPSMGNMPRLEYAIKGQKRSATSNRCSQRLPITPPPRYCPR